jgi:XTP/dITP diphosphohydrolase
MSRKLLIATRNNGKRQELQEILGDSGIEILTLADFPGSPDVKEDGLSFAENAIKKAVSNAAYSGLTTLADDSGLVVDALGGAPGVYSARFAGSNASDEDNNRKLLELMKNIPEPDRTARFVCVIAVCTPDNGVYTVEGICPEDVYLAQVRRLWL